jgi:hypothetical protein
MTKIPKDLSFLCSLLSPWTGERGIQCLRDAVEQREVDWEAVASYANRANLAPAVHQALRSKGLQGSAPAKLREYLEEVYRFNAERAECLRRELMEVVGLLNKAGIMPLLLKGSAALAGDLYPDPAIRFMWDMDLLIPCGRMHQAVHSLEGGGYFIPEKYLSRIADREIFYRAKHYAPLIRQGANAPVELHRRVLSDGCESLLETESVWRESSRWVSRRLPGVLLARMSPTHQVIHCFAHSELAHQNHRHRRLDLRQLHHFAHLCGRWKNELEWDRLTALLEDRHVGPILASYLHLAEQLFGVQIPLSPRWDEYAGRHLSRVLYFIDGKWKRLHLQMEVLRLMTSSFSKECLKSLYPAEKDRSIHLLRLLRFRVLVGRYSRPGAWKPLIDGLARRHSSMG